MTEHDYNMRGFIVLAEHLMSASQNVIEMQQEEVSETAALVESAVDPAILGELHDIVFKLRSHSADEGEDSLGVEMGMQRAADMIENLLGRYSEVH